MSDQNQPNHYIDRGALSDFTWPGTISATAMMRDNPLAAAQVEAAIKRLDEFYVPASLGSPLRCIDGRIDPAQTTSAVLGPQAAGGSAGDALAFRLAVSRGADENTLPADTKRFSDQSAQLGFMPGGHRDDSDHPGKIGCGAIDAADNVVATLANPEWTPAIRELSQNLLGVAFDDTEFTALLQRVTELHKRAPRYFENKSTALDYVEATYPGSVATQTGIHQEWLVLINTTPGTTFATSSFAATWGFQAFNYDVWHTVALAQRLFPEASQVIERERFILARVASAVAALMVLTDGSQRLLVRSSVVVDSDTSKQ